MKKFVDEEKARLEEAEARRNPKVDQSSEETDNTPEEALPLEVIHMIGVQITPILRIRSGGRFR